MIEPNDPSEMIEYIRSGDTFEFIRIFKNLKDKHLFKYIGHQIPDDHQVHEVDCIPQDEML